MINYDQIKGSVMDEETKRAIESLDMRLREVEKKLAVENSEMHIRSKQKREGGIKWCINNLINDKFFDTPKSLKEVYNELKRQGYHYKKGAINTTLTRDFMKAEHMLTRIIDNEDKVYKYVIKK